MQKRKWRKFLAMLLCAANILGQTAPAMAQEAVPVVADGELETQEVSVNEALVETQEVSGNDLAEETQQESSNVVVEEPAKLETETLTIEVQADGEEAAENLARGKNTVASSQEADSVKSSNAVDGNTSSRDSRWGSRVGAAPHWIYVDLG